MLVYRQRAHFLILISDELFFAAYVTDLGSTECIRQAGAVEHVPAIIEHDFNFSIFCVKKNLISIYNLIKKGVNYVNYLLR